MSQTEPPRLSPAEVRLWIIIAIVISLTVVTYFATRADSNDPYAECQTLLGWDTKCRADIASRRLLRVY